MVNGAIRVGIQTVLIIQINLKGSFTVTIWWISGSIMTKNVKFILCRLMFVKLIIIIVRIYISYSEFLHSSVYSLLAI